MEVSILSLGLDSAQWLFSDTITRSIVMRPRDAGSQTSERFSLGVTGYTFDPAAIGLDDPQKLFKFVHENTGRKDIRFNKWTWISKFKCVSLLPSSGVIFTVS